MSAHIEETAKALGLHVVRALAGGMFGATLVTGDDATLLVLKVMPDPGLAAAWTTGAAVAERLRTSGYPAPRYRGTGHSQTAVWSLQEVMPGSVPARMDLDLARQLVALVRRHSTDSGFERPWREDAIGAARGWLSAAAAAGGLAGEHARWLSDALDRGEKADVARTSVVHGDFHHRNCLVDDGSVTGIFDWEIAGPGDWRFDLVTLAFWSLVYPRSVDPDASSTVVEAVREECPDDTLSLMLACQALRVISMDAVRRPERTETAARIMASLEPLLGSAWGED